MNAAEAFGNITGKNNINVPVKESIVRLENSFKGIKKDITIRVYPGSGHGLFEPGTETRRLREEAFQLLTSWVLKRTKRQ